MLNAQLLEETLCYYEKMMKNEQKKIKEKMSDYFLKIVEIFRFVEESGTYFTFPSINQYLTCCLIHIGSSTETIIRTVGRVNKPL